MNRVWLCTLLGVMATAPAYAHVTIVPRESRPGVNERYTVRVPTEGTSATVEVELEIPEGVTIRPHAPMGWTQELKRTGDRVSSIVWRMKIDPGEFAEFGFFGRNPRTGDSIVWKVHQRYADGTASNWVGAPGTSEPASITRLVAADAAADDEATIARWLATYDDAFNAKNLEALAAFYHPDVTIYEGGGINDGWADYRDHHLGPELKAFENLQFAHGERRVTVLPGGQAAYAVSRYTLKAKMGDREIDAEGLETLLLVKGTDGAWKIRHSHTSSRPARRPSGQ